MGLFKNNKKNCDEYLLRTRTELNDTTKPITVILPETYLCLDPLYTRR